MSIATVACSLLLCALAPGAVSLASESSRHATVPAASAGESIYRFGLLSAGKPVRGERDSGVAVEGAAAACVNCHRRSGLGAAEGRGYIPPITGQFLFHAYGSGEGVDNSDLPYVEGARINRVPYTEESLAKAIRTGIAVDGRQLSVLMPHYVLDDAAMGALIGYLKQLTQIQVPGVSDTTLQFATIITPDADPVKVKATLSVLDDYFAEKNAAARAVTPRQHSYHKMMFRATRKWQLHVWQLSGPADTWEAQLRKHLAAEPVFAMLSGVGGKNWAPVHHFCERAALPCLFPNVELPVVAEDDFHSLYFSKGVLLEAGLIAHELQLGEAQGAGHRLVQVYRADDIGAAAARALAQASRGPGLPVVDHALKASAPQSELRSALRDIRPGDELVLWLRPKDLAALEGPPPGAAGLWISGLMGGLENAPLPESWKSVAHLAYPFDLPDKRRIRVDYPLGWFHVRNVPLLDVQVQADTYLACGLLSETLNHIVDTFVRDYLIERIENMLEHRIITGYYPRLTLAPGQRFASKGGYMVHFADPKGTRIAADGEWIVP
ncbi:MAG TPA: hypothetical protein VK130_02435 [Steroidobacteraceae bacterium]|nr:hypothetical protein [Steroidobacteraceae bacterium]